MVRGRVSRAAYYERFATALAELQRFGGLPGPKEASAIWDEIWQS